jgi:putative FmdB family regulatory protein
MPTYALRCRRCAQRIEVVMHLNDYEKSKKEDGFECPKCHSKDLAPQIEAFEVETARKSI